MNEKNALMFQLLEKASQTARMGAWALELAENELTWSAEVFRIHGLDATATVPTLDQAIAFYSQRSRPKFGSAISRSISNGDSWTLDLQLNRPDDQAIWVRVTGEPVYCDAQCTGLIGTIRDITDTRKTTEITQREKQLREILFECSTDAHLIFDETGIIECNQAAIEMLKMDSKEELLNQHPAVFSPEFQPCGTRSINKRLKMEALAYQNGFHRFDWIHTRKDGENFPCEVTLNPVELESGSALLVVWHDISERLRAEASLRSVNERLDLALHNANVGLWDRDLQTDTIYFSDTYKRQLGYDAEEDWSSQQEWIQRVHPEDRAGALIRLNDYLDSGQASYRSVFRMRAKNGEYRWILAQGKAERTIDGEPTRLLGVHVDITDQRQAELERDNFFDLSPDLFCTADTAGFFRKLNHSWKNLLGFEPEELRRVPLISFVHPADHDSTRDMFQRLISGCEVVGFKNRFISKDGNYLWLEWSASPPAFGEHTIYAVARDVSERVLNSRKLTFLNAELQRSTDKLMQSNMDLQQFAYAASHDLQTPLRAITGFAEFLEEDYGHQLDDQAREYISRIVAGTKRMKRLIDELLKYSRVETEGNPRQSVNLRQPVDDALEMLETVTAESNAKVHVEQLPEVFVDAGQISQVFLNLISNAIKYNTSQQPSVTISAQTNSGLHVISVTDNGIGIPIKQRERVFDVFRRLHHERQYPGTGIGLALCKRIVERHRGRIWIESDVSTGSTIKFTLPATADQLSSETVEGNTASENQ